MDVQQPPYNPQDLLDAVVDQRNGLMNDVAMARAVIKTMAARIAEREKPQENEMTTSTKDDEIGLLKTSQQELLRQRDERDARIAEQVAEIARLKAELAELKPVEGEPTA
jgi:hypothetical protein